MQDESGKVLDEKQKVRDEKQIVPDGNGKLHEEKFVGESHGVLNTKKSFTQGKSDPLGEAFLYFFRFRKLILSVYAVESAQGDPGGDEGIYAAAENDRERRYGLHDDGNRPQTKENDETVDWVY